jgi:hypothetical protein
MTEGDFSFTFRGLPKGLISAKAESPLALRVELFGAVVG